MPYLGKAGGRVIFPIHQGAEVKTFPTLFKKTSSGAVQQWRVWVEEEPGCGLIVTEHGQVGGKLQVGSDTVWKGKNVGRSNETTALQQAESEAEAKWRKKQEREGYVIELNRAEAGETNAEGGIAPMLAKPLEDVKTVKFPADIQRKFNGVRCIIEIKDGVVSLWSRKRMRILGVPHIQTAYERAFRGVVGHFLADGELYRHGWSLQKISGYVRKEATKPGFEQLGHFVYDQPHREGGWSERRHHLETAFRRFVENESDIHIVASVDVNSIEEAWQKQKEFVLEGYEGGILRIRSGKYKAGGRSSDLLKLKNFQDLEFPIFKVSEGRGKFEGKAVFSCRTVEGRDAGAPQEFDCCAPGNFEDRAEFFRRGNELVGKMLTVKFFDWTDEKKPGFPVGMAVRDYEG